MTNKEKYTTKGKRLYFLDNLRTFIIFLVILYHAGGVYEPTGFWASFWIVDDPSTNELAGLPLLIIDMFVMPALFFISGYFVLPSLKKKSGWEFLKAKFKRLIVPWIIVVLIFIPLYKVIFLYSRNLPQEAWTTYFHFSSGNISSQSWLWFLPVLFLFNLLYLLLSKANWIPEKISMKSTVAAVFIIGVLASFAIDIFKISGWTLSALIDFQNERVIMYFLVFLLGSLGFQQKVFASKPVGKKLYIGVWLTAWIPIVVYIIFLIFPLVSSEEFIISAVIDRLILWIGFYLSLTCLLYLLIETFWRYGDKTGKIGNELNLNSYYVYLIHVIVLGVIAWALLDSSMPSVLKFLTLTLSTYLACNVIVSLFRRAESRVKAMNQPQQIQETEIV
jgi:fucose 4-O-acetylase-like acetyltransferase